jgi:mono/diheme cytochrome c family protein
MQTYTHKKRTYLTRRLAVALSVLALIAAACNSSSVVTKAPTPGPAGTPAANATTPAPENVGAVAAASATPFVLATPMQGTVTTTAKGTLSNIGVSATGEAPQGQGQPRHLSDFPVELSPAKKAPTPESDAFPPRPTPAVEMANGKIKQQWAAPPEALALQNPLKPTPDQVAKGREWYSQKCVDCHGKNGQGNGWMGANLKRDGQPLTPTNLASQVVQANTDGELFWKITNGRSPMPAHRIRFDDDQRWQMVLFLRTFKAGK